VFQNFASANGDPILSLQRTYTQDGRRNKVNLSIGLYYDDDGRVPILRSVRMAQDRLGRNDAPWLYQPIAGSLEYRRAVQELLFGADNRRLAAGHIATVQTVGGSGALKVGSDLLRQHFPGSDVWVSDPTWDNHEAIFAGSGFTVHRYPYFDASKLTVNFEAMRGCLEKLPAKSIVLLHPCCHNPTGTDLTQLQWNELVNIVARRSLIPFLDMAYQGFGDGIDADCYAVRAFADANIPFLISNSFSKTFSLYGERCGGLSAMCRDADEAQRVLGQMELTIRRNYSSPPTNGGQIVSTGLLNPDLKAMWVAEIDGMRKRIAAMRIMLHAALRAAQPETTRAYLLSQRGMFSFTGFSARQVQILRRQFGIYLLDSGRMCIAGLNNQNIARVAHAFVEVG